MEFYSDIANSFLLLHCYTVTLHIPYEFAKNLSRRKASESYEHNLCRHCTPRSYWSELAHLDASPLTTKTVPPTSRLKKNLHSSCTPQHQRNHPNFPSNFPPKSSQTCSWTFHVLHTKGQVHRLGPCRLHPLLLCTRLLAWRGCNGPKRVKARSSFWSVANLYKLVEIAANWSSWPGARELDGKASQ